MSYTECAGCGKRLWWDDGEYEEIEGEISCFDCIAECDTCGTIHVNSEDTICDECYGKKEVENAN